MLSKRTIFSYGFITALIAASIMGGIYWLRSEKTLEEPLPSLDKQTVELSESEHHHEEQVVKLTQDQVQQLDLSFKTAGPGRLHLSFSARGKIILHPDQLAHIIPKVSGVAQEANKNIGNFVRVGELMAVLESQEMAEIKAAYLAALSKQTLAASAWKREEQLFKEQVSAGQDYLNAKNIYEESLIAIQLAQQKLRAFGLSDEEIKDLSYSPENLRLYQIRSPIDGTVIMRHITKGEFIENKSTIYEVADLSTVWVDIGIYPKDLYRVREGQEVEITVPNENKQADARLIYVSPIVNDETITAKAIAELDNPVGAWRPGVFVNVDITTKNISLPLVIPQEALQSSEGKDFIFVVTPEGFEKRIVKRGSSDKENVEILSGLNPGEQYVANKTFLLKAELGKSSAEHEH